MRVAADARPWQDALHERRNRLDAKRLETLPLFRDLSRKEREQIARWTDEVDVPAGYHLLEQGRLPHEFFVIETGTVAVAKDGQHIADLGPGDFFGEIAIMEHDRRTASVVATTPVTAIVMLARDFETMAGVMPHVAEQIHEAIRQRMQR
jgi:CRP-like cAMP-binding protein